ncbi:hypothetical protein NEOKW01_1267 [Nematocida sp. AWRm80]|nr:hypothetical protein NEOKW01_1267 [Nematocida sp. AWRm80]
MKNTAKFSSIHPIEGIATANKNIYSYFMKSDNSYYVSNEHRYSSYKRESDRVFVLVISKYTPKEMDSTYKVNSNSIEIECRLGESMDKLYTRKIDLSNIGECLNECIIGGINEKQIVPQREIEEIEIKESNTIEKDEQYERNSSKRVKSRIETKNTWIALSIPDGLNRVSIMNIVNSVIVHSRCKGVMIVPLSLAISAGLGINNGLVINAVESTCVAIEDNCVAESVANKVIGSSTMYGNDMVDEIMKKEDTQKQQESHMQSQNNECCLCKEEFDITEFSTHFKSKHSIDVYADQTEADNLLSRSIPVHSTETSSSTIANGNTQKPGVGLMTSNNTVPINHLRETPAISSDGIISEWFLSDICELLERVQQPERIKKLGTTVIYVTETRTEITKEKNSPQEPEPEDIPQDSFLEIEQRQQTQTQEGTILLEALTTRIPAIDGTKTHLVHITKDQYINTAWKGLYALTNIEISKELWLTDMEWKSVGLRVLREKVLFFI